LKPDGIDFTRAFVSQAIDLAIKYFENIHKIIVETDLLKFIIDLSVFNERIKKAETAIFTDKEINDIIGLAIGITETWNPNLRKQLTKFVEAHFEIDKMSDLDPYLPPYAPLKYVENDFARLTNAHSEYVDLIASFNTPQITEIQLKALLLGYVAKTETVGYAFEKQFLELIKTYGLEQKYDVKEIFSINNKVKRNTVFQTDSRAIRDSIAHYRYKIISLSNSWEIQFDNDEDGYNYHKKFSYNEFIQFLDNHHKLYISQLLILQLIGAGSYLKKYMKKS
jgi:hypothetical protein